MGGLSTVVDDSNYKPSILNFSQVARIEVMLLCSRRSIPLPLPSPLPT